jgi:RHS repeat-associated protein
MSTDIGFDAGTPSLPEGGGAVGGLGETFTPDLSTGGASFTIPLDLPNGPGDIGPRLRLTYDSSQGAGALGLGFTLTLPRLLRSVAHGIPLYDDTDALMLEGAGELVRTATGDYRPQVDAGAWRVQADGDGFTCLDRDGNSYTLGTTAAARLADPADSTRVFAWHLEQVADALGNAVTFTWTTDRGQLYLDTVSYGIYELAFSYEQRPDVLRYGRPGFLVSTALRCHQIALRMPGDAQPVLRTWDLGYTQHPSNNSSLLTSVTLSGHAADGSHLAAPPLTLGYSVLGEPSLTRFTAQAPAPPAFDDPGARADLVDWTGDGLPDLLALSPSGQARLWPNLGGCQWGTPRVVAQVPALARSGSVALADINGDGATDLIAVDQPLARYVPRNPSGGFGLPVALAQAPSPLPGAAATRLVDLDGDGAVDLLSSDGVNLALYYQNDGAAGWQSPPQIVGRGTAPVDNLADPHVFLADMTGDGLQDLVRVDGGGVTYWPYLGYGRWDAPIQMANPPQLGFDADYTRLLLADVDGDGAADLIQLTGETVRVWINQSGDGFAAPREIQAVPTARMTTVRVADMLGTGAAGLLWCMSVRLGEPVYFFLDLTGDAKPYLLTAIDNGVGLSTRVSYSTSAAEAARGAAAGRPWTARLPVVLPVVARVDATDTATGLVASQTFHYSDGRWDGVLREFAGFGAVADTLIGDDVAPSLQTVSTFATGLDPATGTEPATMADRLRWRAIRGRLLERARYGPDGSPQATFPFDITTWQWQADIDGPAYIPRLTGQVQAVYERQPTPVSTLTTTNVSFDAAGNVTETVQMAKNPADPSQTSTLRTVTSYATDLAGRFPAKAWRVTQTDGTGTVVADTVTVYDDQPEGTVGGEGLVTARSALALTSAQATIAYGAQQPDFAALGYHQRAGEGGWWAALAAYSRTDDAAGLSGTVTGSLGGVTRFTFDATRTVPATISDPAGNVVQAVHDYRVNRVASLTEASGEVYTASFDPLARPVSLVHPGDTTALPTLSFEFNAATVPVTTTVHQRAVSGQAHTIDSRSRYDGAGRLLERRVRDESGEIVLEAHTYCARGLVATSYQPSRAAGPDYAPPAPGAPHASMRYDALGRTIQIVNPDGSIKTISYAPLLIEEADEEDNNAGGPHAGTPVRRHLDPTGRVIGVQLDLGGRAIADSHSYTVKGELSSHTDPLGDQVRVWYDCLGHIIRADRPECSSRSVYDPAGNPVQAQSATEVLVVREFDLLNRPVTVRYGSAAVTPAISYTYHDAGAPAPPDAGAHTLGGRLVRIDDESGSTVLDYDQCGRLTKRAATPTGLATAYQVDSAYRPDGQLASVTYPGTGNRLTLTYDYDARGQVSAVPGVVHAIGRDVTGRRTSVSYANGVVHTYAYDPLTDRLSGMQLTGPQGPIRDLSYRHDLTGNLLGIDSADPALAASYTFDDLYRLVTATAGDGTTWTYGYNDAGALTTKSDVGDYHYGENGAPATCLTTAGMASFSYTAAGEMASTPWGTQSFDPLGRLITIDHGGQTATFTYDHAGFRVLASAGGHTRITPDPLYAIEDDELVLHLFDGIGVAARRLAAGQTQYLHPDHLGSLAVVTDDTGTVAGTLRYDPFGAVLAQAGAGGQVPLGFTGGVPDQGSGLLYLNARWYAPRYGVFVSPDPVVQNPYDPLCWAAYAYCRNNPVTYTDPSGRSFWGIFLAALAIVALIVVTILALALDIISFGTLTAPIVIGVIALGMVVGGVVGGLAAAQKGGSAGDIVEGVLVGAAVGGWAAFASIAGGGAGAGAAGLLHASGFWGAVVAGAVNGAISGAAMGFAAGYAGGKGSLDDVLNNMWQGAVVGLLAGAVLGGVSYLISPPTGGPVDAARNALRPQAGTPPSAGVPPAPPGGTPLTPPVMINNEVQAAQYVAQGVATKVGGALAGYGFQWVMTSALAPIAETLIIDSAAGAWDLYGVKLLYAIGVVKTPAIKW